MKKYGPVGYMVIIRFALLVFVILTLQPFVVVTHAANYSVNVPSIADLPEMLTGFNETPELIDQKIEEWNNFITKASSFGMAVAEISSTYASYLKSLAKIDATCRLQEIFANNKKDSTFYEIYQRAAQDCKGSMADHKALAKIYAKDITDLTKLAADTSEASLFALQHLDSLDERRRAARLKRQLQKTLIDTQQKWEDLEANKPGMR
ncbi:MAG: hypothetical protein VSS75_011550 [Candidatus Parabeggiatoa sp.]|nr:hypothetical protein [Candidatus Parabeggiatoa sp.]